MRTGVGNVWLEARRSFLPFEGVVGVGYGPKVTGGKVVTRHAIIVLVAEKLPRDEIDEEQLIAPTFRGLPTDVREPRLTLTEDELDDRDGPPEDFCLTDYQWIDAATIHRMRLEQQGDNLDNLI